MLQGVRGQTKKGEDIMYDLDSKINFSVFPGLQVGPACHRQTSACEQRLSRFQVGRPVPRAETRCRLFALC